MRYPENHLMNSPEIHRRGNRWVGRMNGQFAWGRTFAECGVKLATKCPSLLVELVELIERADEATRAAQGLPPKREMN